MTAFRTVARLGFVSALLSSMASAVPPQGAKPSANAPKYFVLIIFDGCRPDYLDLAPMPNLQELMKRGTTFDRAWVGQLISNTPPSHTTLASGCFPRRTGVLGFFWEDPATKQLVYPTKLQPVTQGVLSDLIRDSKVPSFLSLFRAKSRRPIRAYSVSSNKCYAAAGMGAHEADTILFAAPLSEDANANDAAKERSLEEGPGGDVRVSPATVANHSTAPSILRDPALNGIESRKLGDVNGWAVTAALKLVERDPCEVLYLNLPETDEVGHRTCCDPNSQREVVKALDAQLGQLIAEYKKLGRYDQTLFVITADHAMVPNRHVVELPPSLDELEKAGPKEERDKKAPLIRPGFVVVRPPYIWIKNEDGAEAFADALASAKRGGITGAFYQKKNENGSIEYAPTPTTAKDMNPDLIEAYRYLMSTFACPRGPHVVLATEEDSLFGFAKPNTHGGHAPITWGVQHIPMIFAGPGVRAGVVSHEPARLVDIAPTAARLFGLDPSGMDGVVITDALESPSPEDEAHSKWVYKDLVRYQDSLKAACERKSVPAESKSR